MIIKGPDGRAADVDLDNRLKAFAVVQTEDKHANVEGRYWSIYIQVTPTGANDKFFYLKNTGTKELFITDIRISTTVPSQFLYKRVTGTATGGTDVSPVSRKLGDPGLPSAVTQFGVDITGLTDGGILFHEECPVANQRESLKTTSNIIIPQGQAIAFERVAATGLVTCTVSLAESEF